MKKIIGILSLVIAMICSNNAYAELPEISEPTFERGDLIGSLTVGYGWGFSQRLAVEYGVADGWIDNRASLGVGAALGNSFISYYGNVWDQLYVDAICSFHFQFIDRLDTYVQLGLGFGYSFWSNYYYYNDNGYAFFDFTGSVGARYYFNSAFAVNAEVGYTAGSYFMAGITYKF